MAKSSKCEDLPSSRPFSTGPLERDARRLQTLCGTYICHCECVVSYSTRKYSPALDLHETHGSTMPSRPQTPNASSSVYAGIHTPGIVSCAGRSDEQSAVTEDHCSVDASIRYLYRRFQLWLTTSVYSAGRSSHTFPSIEQEQP